MKDKNGVPVMPAIKPDDQAVRAEIPVRVLNKHADKNKALKCATTSGAQFPGVVQRTEGFNPRVYLTENGLSSDTASRGASESE